MHIVYNENNNIIIIKFEIFFDDKMIKFMKVDYIESIK